MVRDHGKLQQPQHEGSCVSSASCTQALSLPSAGNVVSDGNPWCDTHCMPTALRRGLGRRQNPSHKLQTQLLLHGTVPGAPTSRVLPSSRAHPQRRLFPTPSAACLYSKAKTHSKGELHVFRSLIKRGKTTQCWQLSSSQPLPVPCTSNSCFPAGPAPASSLPPPAASSGPRPSTQEGQSQEEGKQLIQPAGKRKGKNTRKEPCSTAVCQWKKNIQALSTGGLDAEAARVKLTHGKQWDGDGHLPRKVLQAPLLLPCQAVNDEPTPGKGWGQILLQEWQSIATPARRLHRYQDRPGGRKPREDPAPGDPGSGNTAFHHGTSRHVHPGPAKKSQGHILPALFTDSVNLVAFIIFCSLKFKTVSNPVPPLDSSCQFLWFCNVKKKFPLWKNPCKQ